MEFNLNPNTMYKIKSVSRIEPKKDGKNNFEQKPNRDNNSNEFDKLLNTEIEKLTMKDNSSLKTRR